MNNFKENLKVQPISEEEKREAAKRFKENELEKYKQFYDNENVQKYFHHVIAAIMIAQNEYYEFHGINIPYRFKSSQSTSDKLDKIIANTEFSYNEKNEIIINPKTKILDALAMKIISRRRPPVFSSTDPEIRKLIEEKKAIEAFYNVKSVEDFSSAEKAGIKPGDVIIEADGTKVTTMDDLNKVKNSHKIGDEMKIKVNRDGQERELTVTLGEQP